MSEAVLFGYGFGTQRETEEKAADQCGAGVFADAVKTSDQGIDRRRDRSAEVQSDDHTGEHHKRKQGRYHFLKPELQRQCGVGAGIGGSAEDGEGELGEEEQLYGGQQSGFFLCHGQYMGCTLTAGYGDV